MILLHRLVAVLTVLCLLSGCAGDPVGVFRDPVGFYRDVRRGNYNGAISRLEDGQRPRPPSLPFGAGGLNVAGLGNRYALEPLHGKWTGGYTCGGQHRDLTLIVFEPRPMPRSLVIDGPMTPRGRAIEEVRGSTNGYMGAIRITPHEQLTFPPGFRPISYEGTIQSDGSFDGAANGPGCGNLHLTRVAGPDNPAFQRDESNQLQFRLALLRNEFQLANATIPANSLTGLLLAGVGACGLVKCPGINLPGIVGMAPGASSGGGGSDRSRGANNTGGVTLHSGDESGSGAGPISPQFDFSKGTGNTGLGVNNAGPGVTNTSPGSN